MAAKLGNVFTSCLFWLIVTLLYLIIGAAIFNTVDSNRSNESHGRVKPNKQHGLNFSTRMLNKYKLKITSETFANLLVDLKNHLEEEHHMRDLEQEKARLRERGLSKWFYFCFITLTTVGYGDVYPVSSAGKAFLIPFAVIGIPLLLATVGMLGYELTSIQLSLVKRLKLFKRLPCDHVIFGYLMLFNFVVFGIFLLLGAGLISHEENWSFVSACYYWFVFFTTIGYGDMIANHGLNNIGSFIGWMIYRWIGLIFFAAMLASLYRYLSTSSHNTLVLTGCDIQGEVASDQNEALNKDQS